MIYICHYYTEACITLGTPTCRECQGNSYFLAFNDLYVNLHPLYVTYYRLSIQTTFQNHHQSPHKLNHALLNSQPPGFPTCDSRFIKTPVILGDNSKCACPKDYPYWREGVGCIKESACDKPIDRIRYREKFNFKPPKTKRRQNQPGNGCAYDYQIWYVYHIHIVYHLTCKYKYNPSNTT